VRALRGIRDLALRALGLMGGRPRGAYDRRALPDARARVAYILAHLATANRERMVWLTHEELVGQPAINAAFAGARSRSAGRQSIPGLFEA